MSKHAAALAAAILITICAGAAVFTVGGSALLNRAGVKAANASAKGAGVSDAAIVQRTQLEQMQVQILQYEAREEQYREREKQYQQVLDQAQSEVQAAHAQSEQLQALLNELQQRGLITIAADGTVLINR
jgi:chromosome segregation ATPase